MFEKHLQWLKIIISKEECIKWFWLRIPLPVPLLQNKQTNKPLVSTAVETRIRWEWHLPFLLVLPTPYRTPTPTPIDRRLFTPEEGLAVLPQILPDKVHTVPLPPAATPLLTFTFLDSTWSGPPCLLLFLKNVYFSFKSQFTCLWPVCLSLPPICSCFFWLSKGLYANSYSHASHSSVIICLLIHSFHKCLLSTQSISDSILGPRDSAESKLHLLLVCTELKTRKRANMQKYIKF